ncbi:SDR family NAD(P)-dependent oxidoreductase, partial [Dactylosporangium sp. NPDC049525]|uniref:SDR family NAD(P)-dependent oxidoreductase n=1 Tax=Dactylosporangium sp. NPDC049525 TaxID=3154730 RepID=UPI00341D8CD9
MSDTKTALVTGANKGLGYEIAAGLGERGYRVAVGARDTARGEAAVKTLHAAGVDAFAVPLDVTSDRSGGGGGGRRGPPGGGGKTPRRNGGV